MCIINHHSQSSTLHACSPCQEEHAGMLLPLEALSQETTRAGVSEASLWAAAVSARQPLLLLWLLLTPRVLQEQAGSSCCFVGQELLGAMPGIFVSPWVLMTQGRTDCASCRRWVFAELLSWPLHGPMHTYIIIKTKCTLVAILKSMCHAQSRR